MVAAIAVAAAAGYLWPRKGPPVLATTVEVLDFGEVRIGGNGTTHNLTLLNSGERPLLFQGVEVSGSHADNVEVTGDDCTGQEIAAGGECILMVTITPPTDGPTIALLTVSGEAPNSPLRIPVQARGVEPRIAVDPANQSFPRTLLGDTSDERALFVRNTGSAPLAIGKARLTGRGAPDYNTSHDGCSGQTLATNQRCEMRFAFKPANAGERTATLEFETDVSSPVIATLTGIAESPVPILVANRDTVDFDTQRVGTAAPTVVLKLRNGGTGRVSVNQIKIDDPGDAYDVDNRNCGQSQLEGNRECEIRLGFKPPREGSFAATLRVTPGADAKPMAIAITGRGIQPRLEISSTAVDFGDLAVGKQLEREIALRNSGSATVRVGAIALGRQVEPAFELSQNPCSGQPLAPGASCTLVVGFRPRDAGNRRGQIQIAHDAGPALEVTLQGNGALGKLMLSERSIDFGEVSIGKDSRRSLKLDNAGAAPVTLGARSVRGDNAAEFTIAADGCRDRPSLPPGQFCTIVIEHRPIRGGQRQATLRIEHGDAQAPNNVPLQSRAIYPPQPLLVASETSVDFGEIEPGRRTDIHTVTLANEGEGSLRFVAIQLANSSSAFQIVPGSCDGLESLAARSSCTFGVRFAPEFVGESRDDVVIQHGDLPETTRISLYGVAVEVSANRP